MDEQEIVLVCAFKHKNVIFASRCFRPLTEASRGYLEISQEASPKILAKSLISDMMYNNDESSKRTANDVPVSVTQPDNLQSIYLHKIDFCTWS